jgi:hypothetical protein
VICRPSSVNVMGFCSAMPVPEAPKATRRYPAPSESRIPRAKTPHDKTVSAPPQ